MSAVILAFPTRPVRIKRKVSQPPEPVVLMLTGSQCEGCGLVHTLSHCPKCGSGQSH